MTAKIKLNAASGGGSISIQAPSSSSNNRVISLPDIADGTLVTSQSTLDATKLSGNLPALNGSALTNLPAGGKFSSYAIIADQKSSNTLGGSFSSGGDRTRDLNTEIADADGIVSISSNQFTLQAGTYLIRGSAPAYNVGRHIAFIYDVTNSAVAGYYGTVQHSYNGNVTSSFFYSRVTISGATVFEIRHRGEITQSAGFGQESGFYTNTYTVVQIFKES